MKTLVRRNSDFFPSIPSLLDTIFFNDGVSNKMQDNPYYGNFTTPAVNIKETDNGFGLEVAVPGMKKEDFKIDLDYNVLSISSEKEEKHEERDEKNNYSRREFHYQQFCRRFTLPDNVDIENIEAIYSDGILHVDLPKKETTKSKPTRSIDIK